MNIAPYQWRADDGYLPPPGSIAVPVQQMAMQTYLAPVWAPGPPPPYQGLYQGPYHGPYQVYQPGQPLQTVARIPAQAPPQTVAKLPAPAPPKPKVLPKKETKKVYRILERPIRELRSISAGESARGTASTLDSASTAAPTICHSTTNAAPPSVRPGINYMYPKDHTMIHVFNKAGPVWDAKYKHQNLQFRVFKIPTGLTVREVMDQILRAKGAGKDKGKGWAATEAYEKGGGGWLKGSTIEYSSSKAQNSLATMGWSTKKGKVLPPTWLAVHKV